MKVTRPMLAAAAAAAALLLAGCGSGDKEAAAPKTATGSLEHIAAEVKCTPDMQTDADEIRQAVLAALADEVGHVLAEGVVESPKDVDAALILGAGFPFFMGGLTPYLRTHDFSYELTKR